LSKDLYDGIYTIVITIIQLFI